MAARLLDAADEVPSFRLEQEFTPEERSSAAHRWWAWAATEPLTVTFKRWEAPGALPSAPASPQRPVEGSWALCMVGAWEKLLWKKRPLSIKEHTAEVLPPERPPFLRRDTPGQ